MSMFKKCKVENCENNSHYKSRGEKGFCIKHYGQLYQYGKILERTRFDPNEIIDCGDYYEICLYNNKHKEVGRAKIDKEDLEKVKNYRWGLTNKGYVRNQKNKLFLHRLILGKPPIGYLTDHQYGDKSDNRKSKLRFATFQQNLRNRKTKGYFWDKINKKWCVRIMKNYKKIYLGRFDDEKIAQKVVKEAKQKYFGEFAYKEKQYENIK